MDYRNDDGIGTDHGIHPADRLSSQRWQELEGLLQQLLDGSTGSEQIYAQVLEHCRSRQISERQLWRMLAVYRADGAGSSVGVLPSQQLACGHQEKIKARIVALIGRLPLESLDDFAGLVALTSTFAARVQFLCDLLVYLFLDREKGEEGRQIDGRPYIEFFAQKLMWELEVMGRIAQGHPLAELADEYFDWLTDRILDGEVLI